MLSDCIAVSGCADGQQNHWLLHAAGILSDAPHGGGEGLWVHMCKHCASELSNTSADDNDGRPHVRMPPEALANGLWRGRDPAELAKLTYVECKVINLAKIYVSVKRIFLDRASYAATASNEAPRYHQKNVVAYPMSPDAALTAIGFSPSALASM